MTTNKKKGIYFFFSLFFVAWIVVTAWVLLTDEFTDILWALLVIFAFLSAVGAVIIGLDLLEIRNPFKKKIAGVGMVNRLV